MTNDHRGRVAAAARLLIAVLALTLPAEILLAQDENEAIGFQTGHSFDNGSLGENIDVLNGALNLHMSIGQKFILNSEFSYQMSVTYGSKIWDSGEWDNTAGLIRRGAFGLGGLMHFGRIYRDVAYVNQQYFNTGTGQNETQLDRECTWYYVTPDGNEHVIPGQYRPDQGILTCSDYPLEGTQTIDTTYFTVSGTGALQNWNGTGAAPTLYILSPDGIRYTFAHFVQAYDGGAFNSAQVTTGVNTTPRRYNRDFGGWYVTKIEDTRAPTTIWVNVEYDTRAGYEHLVSRVTDSAGREILITNGCEPDNTTPSHCKEGSYGGGNAANRPATRVDSMVIPMFAGSTTIDNTRRARYDFAYEWKTITDILSGSAYGGANVLKTISYPTFTKHSGPSERYALQLDYGPFGEMSSRTLPTGAVTYYLYNDYAYLGTGLYGTGYNPSTTTREIETKEIVVNGNSYSWRYTRQATNATNPMVVVVTDPYGNDTIYYYHASLQDTRGQLGFCQEDGWAPEWNDGLNYRIEYYQGSGAARSLVRMETREHDSDPATTCSSTQHGRNNVRVAKATTVFIDDGGRQTTASNSEWDGKGHWKVVSETGSDVASTRTTRTEYVGYDPSRFTYKEVADGKRLVSRTDNTYFNGNVVLSIVRLALPAMGGTAANSQAAPGDIVTAYQYDATANVILKEIGSQGGSCNQGICTASSPKYRIQYAWQGGYLKSKAFFDFVAGRFYPWKEIDRDRDANTGWIYTTRDTAGVPTGYSYDEMGRITDITPQSPEYPTQIEYVTVKDTTVRQGDPAVMGTNWGCAPTAGDFINVCYHYDSSGRTVAIEKRPMDPSLGNSCRQTQYDATGKVVYQTEWRYRPAGSCTELPQPAIQSCPGNCNASCWAAGLDKTGNPGTEYDFSLQDGDPNTGVCDPFGRPRKVTTADGKTTDIDYMGTSNKETLHGIQGTSGPVDAVTTYTRDAWGRMTQVLEPANGGADAFYTYDIRDNLVQVDLLDKATSGRQTRLFTFDAANRPYSTWTPEDGLTDIVGYDPMGNVTDQETAAGNHLQMYYDGAGRLKSVQRKGDWSGTSYTLRQNNYDDSTAPISYCQQMGLYGCSAGRLVTSQDYDDFGNQVLSETYYYWGLNGRLGGMTPQFSSTGALGSLTYMHDNFGQILKMFYPEGPVSRGGSLGVQYAHSNGYLQSVSNFTDLSVYATVQKYNATGRVEVLASLGGVTDTLVPDVRNRPARISVGKGTYDPGTDSYSSGTLWKSGAYVYDGVGNIAAIGSSTYGYDPASRLVQSMDQFFGDTVQRKHQLVYDDYGNLAQDTYIENGVTLQYDLFTMRNQTTGVNNNQILTHRKDTTDPVTLKTTSTTYAFKTGLTGNVAQSDTLLHEFDYRNRMTGVRQITGNKEIARYTYDASGLRIQKEEMSRGTQTYYVRDVDGRPLSEFKRPRGSQTIPEWSKHYIYLGNRLVAMEENTVPTPPGGLRATTASGTVTLTWTAGPPEESITQYTVYRSVYPGTQWHKMGTTPTPTWTETGLVDGTWYQYAVTATGSSESSPSAYLIVQVATTAVPTAPSGLILWGSDGRVDMSWFANPASEWVIGYNVYRNGATTPVNGTLIPGTSFTDLNLTNGLQYAYTVKAVNAWGKESAAGNVLGVTPRDYARTAPPRNVVAAADCSALRVRVSWAAPFGASDVAKYLVYRSPEFPVSGCTTGCSKDVGNTLAYSDPDVTVGMVYQYSVVAVDTAGNLSTRSVPVPATPRNISSQVTVPSAPSVTAEDGKVTVRLSYPYAYPLPYPTMRIYRRKNIDQDCDSYQLVASVSSSNGYCTSQPAICYLDYVDRSVTNGTPYDYVVTNVDATARESANSRTALAIPVASPIAYNECVEDLRSTNFADWKDGAGATASGGYLRRLKVRVQPPGAPGYQYLAASTKGGTQAFLVGYHLYDYYTAYAPGYADSGRLKAIPADFLEGQCVVKTATGCSTSTQCGVGQSCNFSLGLCTIDSGVSCYQDSNCQTGQSCVRFTNPHCAGRTDYPCYPPDSTGNCGFGANDYCTNDPALAGYCPSDNYKRCLSNSDCAFGSCYNAHPWDGYLNNYNDGGFDTFTSNFQNDYQVGNSGCLELKAVYKVYINGKWQTVESGFSDNFNLSPSNPFARCDASTPALYNWYYTLFPGCAAPSDQPAQPVVTPTVSTTAANSVTVSWSPAGVCKPYYASVCSPGCTVYNQFSDYCFWPLCPTGQVCVADPVYQYNLYTNGDGHCVMQSPAACDATHACPANQICETGGIDGYYIYATEKKGTGSTAYNPQYHFKPNVPAAKVDKSLTSYTFNNLAPTYGASLPTQFSFRVAAFANGGKFKDPTPLSAAITPATSTAAMPAPQSVKVNIGAKGAISISWLPGTNYTNLQNYQVFRSITPGGPYTLLGTTTSAGYSDATALAGTDYYYVVKAKGSGSALSDNSPEVSARVLPATVASDVTLRPPANFSARALRPDHPTDWSYVALTFCPNDGSEGVTGYRIYRSNTARGPYTLLTQNQDASATCLDGLHRCEITSPSAGTFAISSPSTTCTPGWNSTCTLIDKTVSKPPLNSDYPGQAANYVYYYVVTAVKRDVGGNILYESAYSVENQGWPNYCSGSLDSCGRFDPDVLPSLPCGLPELSSNKAPSSSPTSMAHADRLAGSADSALAPYRTIGAKICRSCPGPDPGPEVPLPYAYAIPRKVMFHLDHLGSPRLLTNATGGVISTHNYLPFGQEKPVSAVTNTRQFAGHERDKESGLDYMMARYYSSSLDRFLSADLGQKGGDIWSPQSLNRYAYVQNNPLRFRDPNGQCIWDGCALEITVGTVAVVALVVYVRHELNAIDQQGQEGKRKRQEAIDTAGTNDNAQDLWEEGTKEQVGAMNRAAHLAVEMDAELSGEAVGATTLSGEIPEELERIKSAIELGDKLKGIYDHLRELLSKENANYSFTVTKVTTYHMEGDTKVQDGPTTEEVYVEGNGGIALQMGEYGHTLGEVVSYFQSQGFTVYIDGVEVPK